jgi:membrane associated rhomboid family serine protease
MAYYRQQQFPGHFGRSVITPMVQYLIIANGMVFLLQELLTPRLVNWFGLHPFDVYHNFYWWQCVTYMFLHGGFFHILLNMFILWMIGCEVERYWGGKAFLRYYIFCGIGAAIFHLLLNLSSRVPVVGASGAIYGTLLAFAMLFPERLVILFPLFIPIKAKYLAVIFGGIALLFGLFGGQNGVAHFAHLGGMIMGFIYLKIEGKVSLLGKGFFRAKKQQWELQRQLKKEAQVLQLRQTIDAILDRINEIGYQNLTEKEKRILKAASTSLARQNEKL